MRRIFRLFICLCSLAASPGQAMAQPEVVASIKPLQLIAMAVTEGVSEPALVMDESQDPHHPSLRPSQRRAMDRADIFLWTGPQLETGLENVTAILSADVLTAIQVEGLVLYPWGDSIDPHVWLDSRNAVLIAEELVNRLTAIDAANAGIYAANLASFRDDMQALVPFIADVLDAEEFPPFAAYHDGYQYFEKQFGLSHVTSFISNEEVQPGIRQVLAIKKQLEDNAVNCIVVGPSQNTVFLDNQVGRPNMRYVMIDVLASQTPLVANGYRQFMGELAEKLAGCRQP